MLSQAAQRVNSTEADAAMIHIKNFLSTTPAIGISGDVNSETPLLKGNGLDSLGVLQLMVFLSETMNIEITDEDFVPENFETVGTLARFISEKRSLMS